jgi:hypothetical protein
LYRIISSYGEDGLQPEQARPVRQTVIRMVFTYLFMLTFSLPTWIVGISLLYRLPWQ